jgi:hypothetical protein
MAPIDRDIGGSTMIRVSWEVRELIEQEKLIPREPLNDCIKRGILENRKYRQHPSLETKENLKTELEQVTTNPNIPNCGGVEEAHLEVYFKNHPNEKLLPREHIHHINGNHNDNRIENLVKVSPKEHGKEHAQLHKEFPMLNSTKSNDIVGKTI